MATDTKSRILDKALELFNERGAAAVTTNHIAGALPMSPGNLYYHYRNKAEIVLALFARIRDAWALNYALPEGAMPDVTTLARMLAGNFRIQWQYRFFFRELTMLLTADPVLAAEYRDNRRASYGNTVYLLRAFAAAGLIEDPGDEKETDDLAQLLWLVGDFWLVFKDAGGDPVGEPEMEQGVRMFRRLINPRTKGRSQ